MPSDQSINRLYWRSQLNPKTRTQSESRWVTKQVVVRVSPEEKVSGILIACVSKELTEPSRSLSGTWGISYGVKLCLRTKAELIKQCVDPESTKAFNKTETERRGVVSERNKASGLERAAALSLTSEEALPESTQFSGSAESEELLTLFPGPRAEQDPECQQELARRWWRPFLSDRSSSARGSLLRGGLCCHR